MTMNEIMNLSFVIGAISFYINVKKLTFIIIKYNKTVHAAQLLGAKFQFYS